MSPPKVVLFLVILSTPLAWGQRNKKPPAQNPFDKIQNVANFDINKVRALAEQICYYMLDCKQLPKL